MSNVRSDHLRNGNPRLRASLSENKVLSHPFVIGELACGNLGNRSETLRLIEALPAARIANHEEVLSLMKASASMVVDSAGSTFISRHLRFFQPRCYETAPEGAGGSAKNDQAHDA